MASFRLWRRIRAVSVQRRCPAEGVVMIIGNIIAVMIIAAIPWALALPVLRWHPAMQTAQARRTYRLATYGIAFAFSAVSFVVPALGMVWFIPLGAAIWLDIKWFNLSRTRKGRAALAFAKEEAKPDDAHLKVLKPAH